MATVMAVVAGAAGAAAGVAAGGSAPAMHTHAAAANRRAARHDAARLLAKASLPAGAVTSARDPSVHKVLGHPAFSSATPALVDPHRFWLVADSDPNTVTSWLKAHPPAGSSVGTTGTIAGPGYSVDVLGFLFAPVRNVIVSREVAVQVSAAAGGGTAIRIDAEDTWFVPRPRSERVPAGVKLVVVKDKRGGAVHAVTGPAEVAKIVALVNRLPPRQPGVESCPAEIGPTVAIKFYDFSGGPVVAEAIADGSGCGDVGFRLRGKTEPGLSGGQGLIRALGHLLGVHL
jgi:hypothetical protein